MLTGIYVNIDIETKSVNIRPVDFNAETFLSQAYALIGNSCRCMDIARLPHNIDVWVDDEGLLKSLPIAMTHIKTEDNAEYTLAGNLIFLSHDKEGNTTSLSEIQKEYIFRLSKHERMVHGAYFQG